MAEKVYKDDVGTVIEINMQEDISDATTSNILVYKGEGSEATWTATVYNSNYLRYTITSDDLDESGIYYLQPSLVIGSWSGKGEVCSFEVFEEWR